VIIEKILIPLERESSVDFRPIVVECTKKLYDKDILCLRDFEDFLLDGPGTTTTSAAEYRDFCLNLVQKIENTWELLSVDELIRPQDPPYSSESFLSLQKTIQQRAERVRVQEGKGKAREEISESASDVNLGPVAHISTKIGLDRKNTMNCRVSCVIALMSLVPNWGNSQL
jgi:hypothetical protein